MSLRQRKIARIPAEAGRGPNAIRVQSGSGFGTLRAAVAAVEGHDGASIKSLAAAAADAEGHVAVFFGSDRPSTVAAAAHASVSSMDCGALVRDLCARFGGKGGGKPGVAQGGGLDASSDDLVAFARDWLAHR